MWENLPLVRMIPTLLLVGGGAVVVHSGARLSGELVDTVKVVASRWELSSTARAIEADFVASGALPGTASLGHLGQYLRENMKANFGRDPAIDMWGNPYRYRRIGSDFAIVSYGPNGRRDGCALTGADEAVADVAQAIKGEQRRLDRQAAARRTREGDDDVCVILELVRKRGEGGGALPGVSSYDNPYRSLREGP